MQVALKYPETNSPRQSFTLTRPWLEFGIFNTRNPNRGPPFLQSRTAPPRSQIRKTENRNFFSTPLPKHYNPALNTDYFIEITKKILNDFYPKHCPTPECNNRILDKEISTRPDLIRCPKCRHLTSRLSYTPLHHFKLPIWMFGYVLYESLIQYPKVVTATELSKRLRIGYNAASLLKRRFQLFCSDQLPKYKKLTYEALNDQFNDFLLPPNENKDITKFMAKRPYTCVDTVVLYSAGERASQGRKRYGHSGQTASIYLSEKLGGRQVGTLVQTIAIKQGPVFFTSVSNQKADTLGPIIKDHLPTSTPLFTDQGYPWLWGIYKNHRSVNHSARSKDNRFRFARNRWSKNGVHNQVAEGNQRVLKTAFAAYGYIKPKYSQMYLNEFSFIKNANVFGLDVLVESVSDDASDGMRCRDRDAFAVNPRARERRAVRIERKGFVRKIQKKRTENWLQDSFQKILFNSQTFETIPKVQNHNGFGILNSSTTILKARKYEQPELEKYNSFWFNSNTKKFQRNRELEYQKTASKIWNWIQGGKKKGKQYSVIEVCDELEIHKITAMTILRKWIKLRLIARRRIGFARYDRRINFYIKPLKQELPLILYSKLKTKTSKRVTRNEK